MAWQTPAVLGYFFGSLLLMLPLLCGAWVACRRSRPMVPVAVLLLAAAGGLLGFSGGLAWTIARGQAAPLNERWAPGVRHERIATARPGEGPVVMHVVQIDLAEAQPSFNLWPDPLTRGGTDFENRAGRLLVTTGSQAAAATGADLVLNASHFGPIYGDLLFWSYPRRGDPVLPVGAVVQGGARFGVPAPGWPLVVFGPGSSVEIRPAEAAEEAAPDAGSVAFAGRSVLVAMGRPTPHAGHLSADRYPRAALGLDAAGELLLLVVVDGKQPGHSRGLTLAALADRLVALGVHEAVELDGGGSAQLTRRTADGEVAVVNRPSHQKLPRRERPVANHLVIQLGGTSLRAPTR